ncbi:SCO family protein [Dyella acidiphila]|uniref:SCO family protein n=1 Tax=Dyella acidiphila TaxID=2775866 RepID=A0ABR9GCR8_9GAMM|nr:SCO family protein [Dyella acidiphila]MBE1161834.1 SCO family protein [Dyella acidiphila]
MKASMLAVLWLLLMHAAFAGAPPPTDLLARAGIQQHLGAQLPVQMHFVDADGTQATLAQWMDGRPTILMLGYFDCPNLCGVTQQAMAHALALGKLQAGKDVSVIFLSIDPRESADDARQAQRHLLQSNYAGNAGAWHFLMGSDASIHAVAAAVGERYDYDDTIKQYMHPAGAMIVRPDGVVNQYLMGVSFVPRTVRLAVVAASHGTLGNLVDQLVLLCCGYDPTTGRYTLTIVHMMQWLGVAFVSLLAVLVVLLRYGRRGATG